MKMRKIVFSIVALMAMLQSCSLTEKETKTYLVGGYQVNGNLYIAEGDDIADDEWEEENIYIEGFNFKEGVMKKIVVTEIESKGKNGEEVKRYVMKKELEKSEDKRLELEKSSWILKELNGKVLDEATMVPPTMEFNLKENRVYGSGGCNRFFATIDELGLRSLELKEIGSTRMYCAEENVENEYFMTLDKVDTYEMIGDELHLKDENKKSILVFRKA